MSKISFLFGVLALVLKLVVLVPALGVASLLFWLVWFVGFVAVYSYPHVKTLFTKEVGAFEKLKEYLKNMVSACGFTMNSGDPTGPIEPKNQVKTIAPNMNMGAPAYACEICIVQV
ncbi:hypothetical protein GBA52_018161 [Prunus armeniaca]|nr:hypothetical protein GBA52_018161 [Prunus armeniaca]